jgi:hypothetical protein
MSPLPGNHERLRQGHLKAREPEMYPCGQWPEALRNEKRLTQSYGWPVAADSGIGEFERDDASFCLKPVLKR